jgi:hypothetical protein
MSTHQMKRLTAEEIEKIASKAKRKQTNGTETKSG